MCYAFRNGNQELFVLLDIVRGAISRSYEAAVINRNDAMQFGNSIAGLHHVEKDEKSLTLGGN